MLVRPRSFQFNAETAASNKFQNEAAASDLLNANTSAAKTVLNQSDTGINQNAVEEFDRFAETLRSKGVNVFVFDDSEEAENPDAVFPNNWVSFHPDGRVILYPMCAENRRSERRRDIIEPLRRNFRIDEIIDLSHYENENRFLEGTGSIVFDHTNKTAYACLSPRTNKTLFEEVAANLGYSPISFHAYDAAGNQIYHTNVMMCVGAGFAVICLESIGNFDERAKVTESMRNGNLEIVDITFEQMNRFAGNMLEILGDFEKRLLVLSQSAYDALNTEQTNALEKYCELLPMPIPTIEKIGGGSARCMMAEIFLPELG